MRTDVCWEAGYFFFLLGAPRIRHTFNIKPPHKPFRIKHNERSKQDK